MRADESSKTRVCVQYDDHPRLMCTVLCSLMEHQSLVDLAIRCGNNTMHAHKCVLAASSPYFREELERQPHTEQVLINGLDFSIMKSVIEFIYCGETNILEENLKYVVAAAKLFQIRGLQALATEAHLESDDPVYIAPPIFLTSKPKYSSAYTPYHQNPNNPEPAVNVPVPDLKVPVYNEEKQQQSFIEEVHPVPFEMVNYSEINTHPQLLSTPMHPLQCKNNNNTTILPFDLPCEEAGGPATGLQEAFCNNLQNDVEIMYKTPDGEYVQVSDAVIQRFNQTCDDFRQFHFVDENGTTRSVQRPNQVHSFEDFVQDTFPDVAINPDNIDIETMLLDIPGSSMPLIEEAIATQDMPDVVAKQPYASQLNANEVNADILNDIRSMQYYEGGLFENMSNEEFAANFQCEQSECPMEMIADDIFQDSCIIIDDLTTTQPKAEEGDESFPG